MICFSKLKIYIFNIKNIFFILLSLEPYFGYQFVRSTISPHLNTQGDSTLLCTDFFLDGVDFLYWVASFDLLRDFDSIRSMFLSDSFDSLKMKFWQFGKGIFDSLEKEIFDSLKEGKFWQFGKGKFWQFWKGIFDSLEKEIFDSLKEGKFWQFCGKEKLTVWNYLSKNFQTKLPPRLAKDDNQ